MPNTDIKHLIAVDTAISIPKYLQVSNGLILAIEQRRLSKGDQLPSIRQLCDQLEISFDTAKKAYAVLKKRNIVTALHGKCNVINTSGPLPSYHVFLLFNELSIQNKIIYDTIMQSLPVQAVIDMYIYNNNDSLFSHILRNKKKGYSHHIIVPPMNTQESETAAIINECLEDEELIMLNEKMTGINVSHSCIYEDYENDIYSALKNARHLLSHYHVMNIVLPEENGYNHSILKGFRKFCYDYEYIINEWQGVNNHIRINKGELFITLSDENLVQLVDQLRIKRLVTGRDIGIISYNETPLKEVLLQGITTISTDFKKMGELAVKQIMKGNIGNVAVPFKLTLRSSL
jgi:DNA-binding transcriptional regulator YhcF (GntR family)